MSIREKLLMKKIVKREKMKKELTQKKGKGKQTAPQPPTTKQANGNAKKQKPPPKRPVVDEEGMFWNQFKIKKIKINIYIT